MYVQKTVIVRKGGNWDARGNPVVPVIRECPFLAWCRDDWQVKAMTGGLLVSMVAAEALAVVLAWVS